MSQVNRTADSFALLEPTADVFHDYLAKRKPEVGGGAAGGSGALKWTGPDVGLVFGPNSQLRAIAEVYAGADSLQAFARDFLAAWDEVMNLDRFHLARSQRGGRNSIP